MDAAASTPTRSFTNTSASSSTRLFDAVVRKKYEELIQLYGQVAVTALQSYQHQLELQQQQQKQQQQLQWPPDNSHSGRGKITKDTSVWMHTRC